MRNGIARPRHMRHRKAGITIAEMAIALGAIGALVAIAWTFGLNLVRGLEVDTQSARIESNLGDLGNAVQNWYRDAYCRPLRPVHPVPPMEAPEFPLEGADVDLGEHRLSGIALPELGIEEGAFDWQIDLDDDNVARFRVFWHYPSKFDDRIAVMARQFDGYCDDDGDASTAEDCDADPAEERLVLPVSLAAGPVDDPTRRRRLEAWLDAFGIECDADEDGRLDEFCDCGGFRCGGNGVFGGVDVDGDGIDDTGFYDRNFDGRLDFDLNEDLAVDAGDWLALGC